MGSSSPSDSGGLLSLRRFLPPWRLVQAYGSSWAPSEAHKKWIELTGALIPNDVLPSPLLNPLEGPLCSVAESWDLGHAPDFQHLRGVRGAC